ncbi:TIGR03087 family PEP-CTERM/XrtA system glycosyltransferase [Sphingomonas sp. FW199]|uniref:TIGR03087 family PEP-CTERM/XrtA system glycosyltransferase n=1 Tax=Sphingomonas sp. FW199 TaxID=3400217 RepID=UPI003CF5D417
MADILFLAHRVPFPPDRGDKIRSYHQMVHLARSHRVHLIAFADDPRDLGHGAALDALVASHRILPRTKGRARAAAEALTTGRPVSLTAFADPAMRAAVDAVLTREPIDAIFVYSGQMAQYLPASGGPRVIMDFVDMDSAKFADYAATARGPMAWMMQREARMMQAFEAAIADRVEASLFVSDAEAALFRQRTGASRVHAIENGIDTVRFDPATVRPVGGAGPLIVFTGQMDYRPNVDAVSWFARSVMPAIRGRVPDARFAIVGRTPTDTVRALGDLPGVEVTGEVPDTRGWLAAASVVVAPLAIARGVQNKVLEAMAMARPVVVSPAAAQGIDHGGTIRIADGVDATVSAVTALIGDPAAALLGRRAREQVIARYGWAARLAPLDALLSRAPGRTRDAA